MTARAAEITVPALAQAQRIIPEMLARNREEYAHAIPPLEAVTQALPTLGLAWKVLGARYFQVGNYAEAIHPSA